MRPQLPKDASIDKEEWSGNTLAFAATANKITVTGTLVVTATDYDITAKLPLMLRMFEGRIEKANQRADGSAAQAIAEVVLTLQVCFISYL